MFHKGKAYCHQFIHQSVGMAEHSRGHKLSTYYMLSLAFSLANKNKCQNGYFYRFGVVVCG